MAQEKSAGAVVFIKDKEGLKFLLLHHKYKTEFWDFPKGNMERGEKEEETAKREIKEETGLEVEFISGFKEKVGWFYKRENKTIYKEVVYFLAEAKTEEVKISEEHLGYAWLNYENAFKKIQFKNSQEILKKAQIFLNQ